MRWVLFVLAFRDRELRDRKSTRLNSSHSQISYAVFCLNKENAILPPAGKLGVALHEYASEAAELRHTLARPRPPLALPPNRCAAPPTRPHHSLAAKPSP